MLRVSACGCLCVAGLLLVWKPVPARLLQELMLSVETPVLGIVVKRTPVCMWVGVSVVFAVCCVGVCVCKCLHVFASVCKCLQVCVCVCVSSV